MFSRLSIWFYDVPSICYTWNSSICWFVALLTGCPFLVMIGSEVSPWKIPTNSGDLPNLQALQTIPSWCLSVSWKKVKHQLLLNGKMMVFVHGEKWGFMNFNCGFWTSAEMLLLSDDLEQSGTLNHSFFEVVRLEAHRQAGFSQISSTVCSSLAWMRIRVSMCSLLIIL